MAQSKQQKRMMAELRRKSITQSVVFPKSDFTVGQARDWLRSHNLKSSKVDEKPNTLRFRQHDPSVCKKDRHFTKRISDGKILLSLCEPKGHRT